MRDTLFADVQYSKAQPMTFKGTASVFHNVVDAYMPTVILPGAFRNTLKTNVRGVKILLHPDLSRPVGKPTKLHESSVGLELEAKLSNPVEGRDAYQLLKDGVIDALSIGFDVVSFDLSEMGGEPVRRIHEIDLAEVSLVTLGADSKARSTEVSSKRVADIKALGSYTGKPLSVHQAFAAYVKARVQRGLNFGSFEQFAEGYYPFNEFDAAIESMATMRYEEAVRSFKRIA